MCKKNRLLSLLMTVAMIVSLLPTAVVGAGAADVTSGFTVTDIKLYSDTARTNPVSATNPVKENVSCCSAIEWSYSGAALVSGDTVTIPYGNNPSTATTSEWQYGSVAATDIYDSSNNKIGSWHTTGNTTNRKIIIEFSDTAVGKTALSGTLYSPKNFTPTYSYQDHTGIPLTIGSKTISVPYATYAFGASGNSGYKFAGSASNNAVEWRIISPTAVINQLWNTQGVGPLPKLEDVYLEDPIGNVTVSWMIICARHLFPTNTTAGDYAASATGSYKDATSLFTLIAQNPSESYADFKARLTPMQYGYWDDGTGNKTMVVNFGSVPSTTKYEDLYGTDQLGTLLNPFVDSTGVVADKMNTVYENDNAAGGGIVLWAIRISTIYPTVVTPTTYSNAATWSYTLNDVPQQNVSNASGTLTPASSLATAANTAQIVLLDADEKTPIKGAKLTLQQYDSVAGTWSDVAGAVGKFTPDNGMISVAGLAAGTYRWTQDAYTAGYITGSFKQYSDSDCTTAIASFAITATDGNTSFATDTRQGFTVTYAPGDHGTFATQTTKVSYGALTPAFVGEKTGAAGYTFTGWSPSTIPLTVTADAIYTAQWKRTGSTGGGGGGGGTSVGTQYTLTFDTNGGSSVSSITKAPGTKIDLTQTTTKEDMVFDGWYSDPELKKKVTSVTLTGNMTVYAKWIEKSAQDVTYNMTDHFAYIIGYTDGKVRPENNIDRAEAATIFFRLLTDSSRTAVWSTENKYSDVSQANWYNNAVSTMSKANVLNGYDNGTFGGEKPITRAEFAAIVARAYGKTAVGDSKFSDTKGHWAETEIAAVTEAGFVNGYPDGTFHPDQAITRAEAMRMVNHWLGRDEVDETSLLTDMVVWPDNADSDAWYYYDVQEATNSHDYSRQENNVETWTKINAVRDWAALETAWATANS